MKIGQLTTVLIDVVLFVTVLSVFLRKLYGWRWKRPKLFYRLQIIETGLLVLLASYLLFFGTIAGAFFVLLMAALTWNEREVSKPLQPPAEG